MRKSDSRKNTAEIDKSGSYRYTLTRSWGGSDRTVLFIMLNPSTADAHTDDPTIRRCIGFAHSWGFGGMSAANLFAYRATRADDLSLVSDPVGPENDQAILRAVETADLVVAAWGTRGGLLNRAQTVEKMVLPVTELHALGVTSSGHPRHPLYVRNGVEPILYRGQPKPDNI